MRFPRLLLSFVVLFALQSPSEAQQKKSRGDIDRLSQENVHLQRKLDSLDLLLREYRSTRDSLEREIALLQNQGDDNLPISIELTDSLLRVWYIQQNFPYDFAYDASEVDSFSSNVPDSVFVSRLNAIDSRIPLQFNDVVKQQCIKYSEKMPKAMGEILGLCEYYHPIFDEILDQYGLPLELKAIVIVESLMRPNATSKSGAKGLWQFMLRTAKGYGMKVDSWVDERMDPIKSTEAAAKYFRDAYNLFGDWSLAIAAYNCGGGSVNRAISVSGGKRTFWDIYPYLPKETRGYYPAFIGALYATHYYKEYGIVPVKNAIAVPVENFVIGQKLHFGQLEDVVGVPKDITSALNPQYLHEIIPGDTHECVLRLPMEYSDTFVQAGDSLYVHKVDTYLNPVTIKNIDAAKVVAAGKHVHTVKSGDVLGRIAQKYGVSVAQIKKWNGLKNDSIRIGQKLVIYK